MKLRHFSIFLIASLVFVDNVKEGNTARRPQSKVKLKREKHQIIRCFSKNPEFQSPEQNKQKTLTCLHKACSSSVVSKMLMIRKLAGSCCHVNTAQSLTKCEQSVRKVQRTLKEKYPKKYAKYERDVKKDMKKKKNFHSRVKRFLRTGLKNKLQIRTWAVHIGVAREHLERLRSKVHSRRGKRGIGEGLIAGFLIIIGLWFAWISIACFFAIVIPPFIFAIAGTFAFGAGAFFCLKVAEGVLEGSESVEHDNDEDIDVVDEQSYEIDDKTGDHLHQ